MFTDIRKLRTFVAVVEEGSLTGAAERLNVAQPWISVQIKQLEESLDLVLLERSKGKAVQLSPAGRKFIDVARRLLGSCEMASKEIAAIREEDLGKLVLGIDPITLYIAETKQLLADFQARYPEIDAELVSREPVELFKGLKNGQFDLILTSLPCPDDAIETAPVCTYPLHLFVPKAHADHYRETSLKGLRGSKLLSLRFGYHPALYDWLSEELKDADFNYIRCPEDSPHVLLRYASMMGVATLSPDFRSMMPEIVETMDMREIEGRAPIDIVWALMRSEGHRRKSADRLWAMATKLNAKRAA